MMSYWAKIPMVIKALVVWWGGGSGGGTYGAVYNSGWGGGQVTYNSALSISPWAYTVTIWAGGAWANNAPWNNWFNSVFASITAIWWKWAIQVSWTVSKWWDSGSGVYSGGSASTGGSGGAGDWANGTNWVSYSVAGNWGNGTANSISWSSVTYWGWGGWSASASGGAGGAWWGGNWYHWSAGVGANGGANTGGGSGASVNTTGDVWWSWIVILSYATDWSDGISPSSTGGTKTTSWGQTIHTFTSSWTFTAM